jgi:anthranilate phosphoribosyltransferase
MDIKHILKDHAYQNIPLNFEEAYELGRCAIAGCNGDTLSQIQTITALSALHNKATYEWIYSIGAGHSHGHELPQNSAEQIAGICAAVFDHDIAKSSSGFLNPRKSHVMDNCGMGGDLIVTANVSTISAFIACAAGATIAKHGSPANADVGRHGSSDFISMLGINTYASKSEVENCIEQKGFGYTEALDTQYKRIHLQTHEFARLPHMNDIIGPITNPVSPKLITARVLGVNHLISPRIIAEVYAILNAKQYTNIKHGLFVRGYTDERHYEGMDEVSICSGGTNVVEFRSGEMIEYHLQASDFGLEPVAPILISPPGGMSKGKCSLAVLKGEMSGPILNMVLANASLLLYLDGFSKNLKQCYKMAEYIHMSGDAYRKAMHVASLLPKK